MDFYELLGVSYEASSEEIKKAYKIKAREHHPDMHVNSKDKDDHTQIFKNITEAFDTLSDSSKKFRYDGKLRKKVNKPLEKPIKTKEDFQRENEVENFLKKRWVNEPTIVDCQFYGNSSSGRSIMVHVKLTPQELKNGCNKSTYIKKRDFCGVCGGDGFGTFPCKVCNNHKIVKQACGACNCEGVVDGPCGRCNGNGFGDWIIGSVSFKVPKNSQPGHSIMLIGQGESATRKTPGNVKVVLV